jgi:hypothetical protein
MPRPELVDNDVTHTPKSKLGDYMEKIRKQCLMDECTLMGHTI